MAGDLFLSCVEQTAALTAALVAVLILRRPIRSLFGARAAYALWLLVPAAMLAVALPGRIETTPVPIHAGGEIAAPASGAGSTPGLAAPGRLGGPPDLQEPSRPAIVVWASGVWALGALVAGVIVLWRQHRFVSALGPLRRETLAGGQVFHSERSDVGPVLVGALRPRIVLPGDFTRRFTAEEQAVVVAHERAHLTGGDAQINLMTTMAQVLFWFHPLVHVASRLIRMDQELACDESVVIRSPGARRLYAEALLKAHLASPAAPLACQWPGSGPALTQRIAHLNRPLPRRRRVAGGALAAVLIAAGAATSWTAQPPRSAHAEAATPVPRTTLAPVRPLPTDRQDAAAGLVRAGAEVDVVVPDRGTPLILAARKGQVAMAQSMLKHGAEPDRAAPGDGSPLITAAGNGDLAMVDLLLAHGADPDLPVSGDGSPLIAAAAAGHIVIIDRLLAAGALVDRVVPGDETALINAAREGRLAAVQRLVEAGADVNLAVMAPRAGRSDERRSPLGMAQRGGRQDVVDYLVTRGARP